MELELGKRYRFSFLTGVEEEGTVIDILSHPDVDPIYKVEFSEGPTGVRLVRASRLAHAAPVSMPGPIILPDIPESPPTESSIGWRVRFGTWWAGIRAWRPFKKES